MPGFRPSSQDYVPKASRCMYRIARFEKFPEISVSFHLPRKLKNPESVLKSAGNGRHGRVPIHAQQERECFLSLFYSQFSNFYSLLNFPSHRMTPALLSHFPLANRHTRRDNACRTRFTGKNNMLECN